MPVDTQQQNTVFLVALKAPARCETGEALAKARLHAVQAAKTMEEFFTAEGKGWKKFIKHVLKCPACLEYEQSRGRLK